VSHFLKYCAQKEISGIIYLNSRGCCCLHPEIIKEFEKIVEAILPSVLKRLIISIKTLVQESPRNFQTGPV